MRKLYAVAAGFAALLLASPAFAVLQLDGQWGSGGSGPAQFANPTDVAVAPSGTVGVTDQDNHRVQLFTPDGNPVGARGSFGGGDGQLNSPVSLAFDQGGNLYVSDRGNTRVQKFGPGGEFVTKWGTPGVGDGEFGNGGTWGIAVDPAGNVYVADSGNNRIQKFSPDGAFLTKWGATGAGNGQFNLPRGIAVDSAGNVYVADRDNHRVQKFSSTGVFIRKWGTKGKNVGQFDAPYDVAVDSSGNVYVAEFNTSRIQRFTADGVFLSVTSEVGTPRQLFLPHGITAGGTDLVYVADQRAGTGNRVLRLREVEPEPELGRSVGAQPVRGTVLVKFRGTKNFIELGGKGEIPKGSEFDATRGTVRLTVATDRRGGTATGDFSKGKFTFDQKSKAGAPAELDLKGDSFRSCPRRRARRSGKASQRRPRRRLYGNARGRFRTSGRYSAATLRGTRWVVDDRCDGTLTRVIRGSVSVKDLVSRKTVTLRRGRSYLARPRGARRGRRGK